MKLETGEKLLARIRRELRNSAILTPEEAKNYHPVVELAKIGANPKTPPAIAFAANEAVAKYVTPRPAAVDPEGNAAPVINVQVASYALPGSPVRPMLNGKAD